MKIGIKVNGQVLFMEFTVEVYEYLDQADHKDENLASFSEFNLIIIDDLGIELNSEYAQDQVYNVVDSRYLSHMHFIITTNLALTELKDPKDIAHARTYDRILEYCSHVRFSGRKLLHRKYESHQERHSRDFHAGGYSMSTVKSYTSADETPQEKDCPTL